MNSAAYKDEESETSAVYLNTENEHVSATLDARRDSREKSPMKHGPTARQAMYQDSECAKKCAADIAPPIGHAEPVSVKRQHGTGTLQVRPTQTIALMGNLLDKVPKDRNCKSKSAALHVSQTTPVRGC